MKGLALAFLVAGLAPAAWAAGEATRDPRAPLPLVLRESGPGVEALQASPQGSIAACGDSDGAISVYDLGQETLSWKTKRAHPGGVLALAFDPGGGTLYSLGKDAVLKSWDAAKGGKPLAQSAPLEPCARLWLGPDRRFLVTARAAGGLLLVKRQTLSAGPVVPLASNAPCVALLALKEGHCVCSQSDGLLSYVDPDRGVIRSLSLGAAALDLAAISMDGEERYAAALLGDGSAVFVDLKDLSIRKRVILAQSKPAFAFVTAEAKKALLVDSTGGMDAFRLPGGAPEAHAQAVPATAACMVDGGNRILLAGADGGLRVVRHPGVQAAFVALLDRADQAEAKGQFDAAIPQYATAYGYFRDPAVRDSLDQAKAARKSAMQAQRDQMKAMSRGTTAP
jgi:hypothetical protein